MPSEYQNQHGEQNILQVIGENSDIILTGLISCILSTQDYTDPG